MGGDAMCQFMWRSMTLLLALSTWAIFANAQTASNATSGANTTQATNQANQAAASNAQANPAAANPQANPAATQPPKVQPGVRTPIGNLRQPIQTVPTQQERNAARQPNVTTQS